MKTLGNCSPAIRKLRLAAFFFFAFPLLVRPAAAQTERVTYDVISIKRHAPDAPRSGNEPLSEGGRLRFSGIQLSVLMTAAFRAPGAPHQLKRSQIVGLPGWADTELYDVEAMPEPGFVPTYDQAVAMIRALLEERFALKTHREIRDESVFALVLAKDGIDGKKAIRPSRDQTPINRNPTTAGSPDTPAAERALERGQSRYNTRGVPGAIQVAAQTMAEFAAFLSFFAAERPVIDRTGLKGLYDIDLQYTPDFVRTLAEGYKPPAWSKLPDRDGPSLFEAIQQQLGLKLESATGPVEKIVVDHVEKPTDN